MKAVILAAGKGTRMRGLCDQHPKPLMPLANRPALELTVERLREAGAGEILVVIGHQLDRVKEWAADRKLDLQFVVQESLNGTGGALMLAEEFVNGESFFLAFGDVLAHSRNYHRVAQIARKGARAVLTVHDIGTRVRVGAVFTENNRLTRIVERPTPDEVSCLVSAGIFIFPPEIFEMTRNLPPAPNGEHELTGGIQKLAEQVCEVRAEHITGYWANLTDPDALLETNLKVQKELAAQGVPLIDDNARIAPEAKLHKVSAVGAFAEVAGTLGPNVSVGRGCRIAPGARLKSCILLENACIEAGAVVENAVVEAGGRVPPHAVIRSNASETAIIWKRMFNQQREKTAKPQGG